MINAMIIFIRMQSFRGQSINDVFFVPNKFEVTRICSAWLQNDCRRSKHEKISKNHNLFCNILLVFWVGIWLTVRRSADMGVSHNRRVVPKPLRDLKGGSGQRLLDSHKLKISKNTRFGIVRTFCWSSGLYHYVTPERDINANYWWSSNFYQGPNLYLRLGKWSFSFWRNAHTQKQNGSRRRESVCTWKSMDICCFLNILRVLRVGIWSMVHGLLDIIWSCSLWKAPACCSPICGACFFGVFGYWTCRF